jgi:hypothetical protein
VLCGPGALWSSLVAPRTAIRKVVTWDVLVRESRVCMRYREYGDREESLRRRECAVRNRVEGKWYSTPGTVKRLGRRRKGEGRCTPS